MNVSATDSNDLDNFTSSQEDSIISESSSQNILTASDTGSFADLNTKITQAEENATVTLQNNYAYNSKTDLRYYDGITIDKSLTIDGQGYTIDAANTAKIFNIKASKVVLKNICFIGANSTGDGGTITWNGINGKIENSTFKNNYAPNAGAIVWNGANGTIINSDFINNTVDDNSGAISWNGVNGVINSCNFLNNKAKNTAGAISWNGVNGSVINSVFTNNFANRTAGAIQWAGDTGCIRSSRFTGNNVSDAGSAVYWIGVNGTVLSSNFTKNTAQSGNALFEQQNGNIKIKNNNQFKDNTVTNDFAKLFLDLSDNRVLNLDGDYVSSGVVYINANNLVIDGHNHVIRGNGNYGLFVICGENVTLKNIIITNCSSLYRSAVYWMGNNGVLTNSILTNNSIYAEYKVRSTYGGAINWQGDNGTVFNCNFTNNLNYCHSSAGGFWWSFGGAIYWGSKNGVIFNSVFDNNKATSDYRYSDTGYGAAMNIVASNVLISSCNFTNTVGGGRGGALFISGQNNTLLNLNFINSTTRGYDGGAVVVRGTFKVINSTFIKNSAGRDGGALDTYGAVGIIDNCTFINNTAAGEGGAMRIGPQTSAQGQGSDVYNCTFIGNNAGSNGGAIIFTGASSTVSDCTFTNNNARSNGGAIHSRADSLMVINSNFIGNTKNKASLNSINIVSTYSYYFENLTYEEGSVFTNNAINLLNRAFWVGPNANGTGTNSSDLANWTYAYNNIAQANTIYFTQGVYSDIVNQTLWKQLYLKGIGEVIFDLNNSGCAFSAGVRGSVFENFIFKNGYNTNGGALSGSIRVVNCTFINNSASSNGGAVYNCLSIVNCTFINNSASGSGGAVYADALNISGCKFINNTADFFNDIRVTNGFVSVNNTFTGSYICMDSMVRLYYESAYLKIAPSNSNITVKYYINDEFYDSSIIKANSTDTFYIDFSQFLNSGVNKLDVVFKTGEGNKYVNNMPVVFEYFYSAPVIYVSPNGGGSGREGSPTNWDDALGKIVDGATIIMLEGYYYGIYNQTIDIPVSIVGVGDVFIDAWGNGNVFTVSADYVSIKNINIVNGNSTSSSSGLVVWSGNYGTLSGSSFVDNEGYSLYLTGNYASLFNCTFNNVGVNNLYLKSGNVYNSYNNTFIGFYFDLAPYKFFYNSTSTCYMGIELGDIFNIIVLDSNGVVVRVFNNTSSHVLLNITGLEVGNYTLVYNSLNDNVYVNSGVVSFSILSNGVIYVSPSGSGVGTVDDPTSWSKAYSQIGVGGTVYFTSDVYGRLGTISKTMNLVGLGNVTVDGQSKSGVMFTVNGHNVMFKNINFINGYYGHIHGLVKLGGMVIMVS